MLPQNAREVQPIQFFRKLAQTVRSGQWPADLFRRVASRIEGVAWKPRLEGLFARISTKLYIGIGAAVALTFIASLGAWLAFDRVGDAQTAVNETTLPQLARSFAVAQQGSALAVAAPRLIGTASREELAGIEAGIRAERRAFEIQLSALTSQSGERFDRVRIEGGALVTNLDAITRSSNQRFALRERADALRAQLAGLEAEFARLSGSASDALKNRGALAIQLLTNALDSSDAVLLQRTQERFERILGAMPANRSSVARLSNLGLSEEGVFGLCAQQIALAERQRAYLTENRKFAAGLLSAVETLVTASQENASVAARAAQNAIGTGRIVLIVVNGISIVGAVLVAWLFVGRLLLPRLQALSDRMRAMADGDLEAEVEVVGRDEVGDMAAALEVFRRHAIEVQRLNLVEKLAEELRGKNDQLTDALNELREAQNRIVAQEKLAGLGELAAGVAHEIRNPLNFVFNYAEVSSELIEELNEELEAEGNGFTDAQKQLIEPIRTELDDSLKRIRSHGGRADRIVRDMLKMGGATGERQPTDINSLVADQVRLALEVARGGDEAPPLDIEQDLDPGAGEVEIVPQDIGRVLQNLILNARYAAEERRLAEEQAGKAHQPKVLVSTRRLDERLEVRVRDNGTGIPDDVVEKIFNPFFTTKPTDKGTGLGLSLCNDIMRGHGGAIRVDTQPDSHTEMIVELPLTQLPRA